MKNSIQSIYSTGLNQKTKKPKLQSTNSTE